MKIVNIYVMDKLVAEYPDCHIIYDGSWVFVVPEGSKNEFNDNVCRFPRDSKWVSVIEKKQGEKPCT